ncbi:MAG: hypothetical protein ACK5P7_07800 [Bdellovibrio sp.]|jgi:hypothetical protein
MGISEKINQLASDLQDGVKNTSTSLLGLTIKVVTAFFIGLTMALITQELIQFGTFAFVFMMLVVMALTYKLIAKWSLGATLVFDLVCVLMALVLRMYIMLAP